MPVIDGSINRKFMSSRIFKLFRDLFWDRGTQISYGNHVRAKVLEPAGVVASFDVVADSAFGYLSDDVSVEGWNSGNLRYGVGAVGWRFSVDDLGQIADTILQAGSIISIADLQQLFGQGMGFRRASAVSNGQPYWIYGHQGDWLNSSQGEVHALVLFCPGNTQIVVLTNSKSTNFLEIVLLSYIHSTNYSVLNPT
jgi:hypothetical protein